MLPKHPLESTVMYSHNSISHWPIPHRYIANGTADKCGVEKLMESGKHDINAKTPSSGDTALMVAIVMGQVETAVMLAHFATIEVTNRHGQTASLLAMQYGMPSVADILIARGENITTLDQFGHDYFYYLIRNGEYHRYRRIRTTIDLNQRYDGMSLTALAAKYGHFLLVYDLLDNGIPFQSERYALTLMDCAIAADEVGYVRHWLSQPESQEATGKIAYITLSIQRGSPCCFSALFDSAVWHENQIKTWLVEALTPQGIFAFPRLLRDWKTLDLPVNSTGDTLLHLASDKGYLDTVTLLIQRGADALTTNGAGKTAFHLAVDGQHKDVLCFLLDALPPENWPLSLWDNPEEISLEVREVLLTYKKRIPPKPEGSFQFIENAASATKSFFQSGGRMLSQAYRFYFPTAREATPLHSEIICEDNERNRANIRALLETYAVDSRNAQDETPLMIAAANNRVETMALLLSYGADLEATDHQRQTPFHHAAKRGALQACLFLLPILRKKRMPNKDGHTPLLSAIANRVASSALIHAVAREHSLDLERSKNGFSALHICAASGGGTVLETILEYLPIDLEGPSRTTALQLAASSGYLHVMEFLIEHGANTQALDEQGNSVIEYALAGSKRNEAVFKYVKPLISWEKPDRVAAFLKTLVSTDFAKALQDPVILEAASNYVTEQGQTCFHLCALFNAKETLACFLTRRPELLNATDDFGNTMLHYIAVRGSREALNVLMVRGKSRELSINALNHEQLSPLFFACETGRCDIVCVLLTLRADITLPNANGITPTQIALLNGHIEIAKTLLIWGDQSLAPRQIEDLPDFAKNKIREKYGKELRELQALLITKPTPLRSHGLYSQTSSASSSCDVNEQSREDARSSP